MEPLDFSRSVLRVEVLNKPVGTAFIAQFEDPSSNEDRLVVITCAHVIESAALLLNNEPGKTPFSITLCSVLRGEPTVQAKVDWSQVHKDVDLALLEIPAKDQSKFIPLHWATSDQCEDHEFRTYGFAVRANNETSPMIGALPDRTALPYVEQWGLGRIVGLVRTGRQRRLQLRDCNEVTLGFSGAPVVDLHTRRVAAILSEIPASNPHSRGTSTAWGVPSMLVQQIFPDLTVRFDRPYRGSDPFTASDARYWIDPTDLGRELMQSLENGSRLLAIVGPSGVGKSSLLSAGLLPGLQDLAQNSGAKLVHLRLNKTIVQQLVAACKATAGGGDRALPDSAAALYDAFLKQHAEPKSPTSSLLLILDQFEEILLASAEECHLLASALESLLDRENHSDGRLRLIVALREHFLGLFGEQAPQLKRRIMAARRDVPLVMTADRLRQIIEEPARIAGWPWPDQFVSHVLAAVSKQYSAEGSSSLRCAVLPALQVFLTQRWDQRENKQDFEQDIGTALSDSLGSLVDGALDGRTNQQALFVQLLVQMVTFGAGFDNQTPKGRSRGEREIIAGVERRWPGRWSPATMEQAIRSLVDGRVLSVRSHAPTVGDNPPETAWLELVHDAVLTGWKPLQPAIDEQREFLQWESSQAESARALQDFFGQSPRWATRFRLWLPSNTMLLEGRELITATTWSIRRNGDMSPEVATLVEESRTRNLVWRSLTVAITVLSLGTTVIFFLVTNWQKKNITIKNQQERIEQDEKTKKMVLHQSHKSWARLNQLSMSVLGEEASALVSAIQSAEKIEQTPEDRETARSALLRGLLAFDLRVPFDLPANDVIGVALTEDGTSAVFQTTKDGEERFELFDAPTGARRRTLSTRRSCRIVFREKPSDGWDCESFEAKDWLEDGSFLFDDSALLLSTRNELWVSNAPDPGIRRISLDNGEMQEVPAARELIVTSLARSKNGSSLAIGAINNTVLVLAPDGQTKRQLSHPGPVLHVAVSNQGWVITHGVTCSCMFSDSPSCQKLSDSNRFGSVSITDDGSVAMVSSYDDARNSQHPPTLDVVIHGKVTPQSQPRRAPAQVPFVHVFEIDWESDSRSVSDPVVTVRGFRMDTRRLFAQNLHLSKLSAMDFFNINQAQQDYDNYEYYHNYHDYRYELLNGFLQSDGSWTREEQMLLSTCDNGKFRPTTGCKNIQVFQTYGGWIRVKSPEDSLAPALHSVVTFDPQSRLALLTSKNTLELVEVSRKGTESRATLPCKNWRRDDFPRGYPLSTTLRGYCDGKSGVLSIHPDAPEKLSFRPSLVAPSLACTWARMQKQVMDCSDTHVVVEWEGGTISMVDLSSGNIVHEFETSPAARLVGCSGETIILHDGEQGIDVYDYGTIIGKIKRAKNEPVDLLPTIVGPLLWLHPEGKLVDRNGKPVPGACEAGPATNTPQIPYRSPETEKPLIKVSPGGDLILLFPQGDTVYLTELIYSTGQASCKKFESGLKPANSTEIPEVIWIQSRSKSNASFLLAKNESSVVWRRNDDQWHSEKINLSLNLESIDIGFISSYPNEKIKVLAISRNRTRTEENKISAPESYVEFRRAETLELVGTLAPATGAWFLDEEHLFLDGPARVVSIRPEDLRQQACKLLRDRTEFDIVKEVCNSN